jgi:hypothetical protein
MRGVRERTLCAHLKRLQENQYVKCCGGNESLPDYSINNGLGVVNTRLEVRRRIRVAERQLSAASLGDIAKAEARGASTLMREEQGAVFSMAAV